MPTTESGNLRKSLQIREQLRNLVGLGEIVASLKIPHRHMERMTVSGEGRPLHAWFIVHTSVFNVTMFVNSVKDCLDLKIS